MRVSKSCHSDLSSCVLNYSMVVVIARRYRGDQAFILCILHVIRGKPSEIFIGGVGGGKLIEWLMNRFNPRSYGSKRISWSI